MNKGSVDKINIALSYDCEKTQSGSFMLTQHKLPSSESYNTSLSMNYTQMSTSIIYERISPSENTQFITLPLPRSEFLSYFYCLLSFTI